MMIQGTATDYIDLLDVILQTAQENGVTAPVINAGGTGYVVGDILTVAGGTTTGAGAATLEVLTLSGSAVATMKVKMAGAYSSNPSTTANAVTGGTGSSATVDLTMLAYGWTQNRRTQQLASSTIAAGGTGYSVGDLLTIVGGVGIGTTAIFRVSAESAGVVTAVDLGTGSVVGSYAEVPTNPVSTTGGNADCTLTITWADSLTQDSETILNGNGAGSDNIYVGIRTFNDTAVFNWELAGFTGYSSSDIWDSQPGISFGRHDQATPADGGSFVGLASTAAQNLEYWVHIDSYSIAGVARNSTSYQSFYLGWLNPFGTASEFTYPLCIAGNTSDAFEAFNATQVHNSGISDPIGHQSTGVKGPMQYRNPAGTWDTYQNGISTGGSGRTIANDKVTFPTGNVPTASIGDIIEQDLTFEDNFLFSGLTNNGIIPQSADPGAAQFTLAQTPDSGGDISFLWPITLVEITPGTQIHGELRNVFWVSNDGGIVAEDDFRISSIDYRVFQAGARSNNWAFWALREN